MSRTYRKPNYFIYRAPKTANELKQIRVSDTYYDDEYRVRIRRRFIPTRYDDIRVAAYNELDHQ